MRYDFLKNIFIITLILLFLVVIFSSYLFVSVLCIFTLIFFCKQKQDYIQSQTESRLLKEVHVKSYKIQTNLGYDKALDRLGYREHQSSHDSFTYYATKPTSLQFLKNFTMFGNHLSPRPKPTAKLKLNSTMPILPSSPMSTRHRSKNNDSLNKSVLSPAGPLLSTPFMPQIKRALGLEPCKSPYYSQRRHSLGIAAPPTASTLSAGTLPHVRLNKPRRLSLSERNSTMLNRSSTVKIAPPVPGKVASPSLYMMRNEASHIEDRSTPDTYAVISALKERRKRSINAQDETPEYPNQQAKRRRQESQQSTTSTSSMPSLPDNLPDLSNPDFSMRLETPSIKRPSRPSQDDVTEWERAPTLKKHRSDQRNNPILSSLSSSQRFIAMQKNKRKADTSVYDKENDLSHVKAQKRDPPKLTHINFPTSLDSEDKQLNTSIPSSEGKTLRNGHHDANATLNGKPEKQVEDSAKNSVLKNIPSLKKKPSIYSGLSTVGSFRKAQYANVVATQDDYDSDREAEHSRVKQMLKDLDESFSDKKVTPVTTVTTTTTTATAGEVKKSEAGNTLKDLLSSDKSTDNSTSSTASLTTATTTTASTASVLSALGNLPKSPIQETNGPKSTGPKSAGFSFGALGSQSSNPASASSSTNPIGQSLTVGALLDSSLAGAVSTTPSAGFFTSGTSPAAPAGNQTALSTVTGSTTQSARVASSTPILGGLTGTQSPSSFSFGLATSSASTSPSQIGTTPLGGLTPQVGVSSALGAPPPYSTTPATGGFPFGSTQQTTATPTSTATTQLSTLPAVSATGGFSFSAAPASLSSSSSAAAPVGTSNPLSGSTAASSTAAGFSFLLQASSATSALPSLPAFGAPTSSTKSSTEASSAPSAGKGLFNFGSSTATVTPSSTATAGFTFGGSAGTVITTTASSGAGFTFGGSIATPASTSASSGFAFGSSGTTTSTAPAPSTGFSFGATTTAAPAAQFGGQTSTSAAGIFGSSTPGQSTTATSGFSFGSTGPSTQQFSAPFGAPAKSNTPSVFGSTPTVSTASAPFTFNAGGSANSTAASSPFAFGTTTTAAAVVPFGTGSQSTTAPGALTFGGPGTQPQAQPQSASLFQFGQGQSSTVAPAFGAATTQASSGFSFGSASQPATAFGSTSQQTPAFGSTNQPAPAFGSTNQQTPAFGSANQPPAFGSTAAPAFGMSTTQSSAPGFCASSPKANTPVFGATSNSSGSVFGTGAPGFAKSHSTPAFGTSTDSAGTGTFNFGAPAPNVNPFGQGQTTPAKQTGSAFGHTGTDSTPQQQTGSMFQFGSQANINSSASKGFDFSSAGTPNAAGFNFSAAPSFGGPASSTGGFNMGTAGESSAPRAPRGKSMRRRQTRR